MKTALTFDDVQIEPGYSDIPTRSICKTVAKISKTFLVTLPVLSAPMDTVTEGNMAFALGKMGGVGFIHRFMPIEEQCYHVKNIVQAYPSMLVGAAVGVKEDYLERAGALIASGARLILIDVAHGHHLLVKTAIKKIKNIRAHIIFDIVAGNVATYKGAKDLCKWGADSIRCGIGGGCFIPDSLVWTEKGYKPIQNIRTNDKVLTHTGQYKSVTAIYQFDRDEEILEINDIKCTKNHEFYAIHKNDADKINNDEELHKYAKWIQAQNLTEDYLLIECLD